MSFYLLSDSEESWQRTLIYQTIFESYVVFIQQYKDFSHENWVTSDRFIIPKPIVDFVATPSKFVVRFLFEIPSLDFELPVLH